jgi:hypothetical protein
MYLAKDFVYDAQKEDSAIVVTAELITFALVHVQMYNSSVFQI